MSAESKLQPSSLLSSASGAQERQATSYSTADCHNNKNTAITAHYHINRMQGMLLSYISNMDFNRTIDVQYQTPDLLFFKLHID